MSIKDITQSKEFEDSVTDLAHQIKDWANKAYVLDMIERHSLSVVPQADGWVAMALSCKARGATVAEAVHLCVKQIQEKLP